MKIKFSLSLAAVLCYVVAFSQTPISINKKPNFYSVRPSHASFGITATIPEVGVAMVVKPEKGDFAVTMIKDNAEISWTTLFDGYPLAIGYFKNNIMAISSTEKTFFKGIANTYVARIIDPKTGKLISEKTIYEGSKDYMEDPKFSFSADGSQLTFIARQTGLGKTMNKITFNPFKNSYGIRDGFRSTKSFSIITYNKDLTPSDVFIPLLPKEDAFQTFTLDNGNLVIASFDVPNKNITFDLYDASKNNRLAKSTLKLSDDFDIESIDLHVKYNAESNSYYFATLYEVNKRAKKLLVGKIDFSSGKSLSKEELFDNETLKQITKSHKVINKQIDNFILTGLEYFQIQDLKPVGNGIAVEFTTSFITTTQQYSYQTTQSSYVKFYDQNLTLKYNVDVPRYLMTSGGEGSALKYLVNKNNLTILANASKNQMNYIPVSLRLDLTSGEILSYQSLFDKEIGNSFYLNTNGLGSYSSSKFLLPYFERFGSFKSKYDVVLQVANLE